MRVVFRTEGDHILGMGDVSKALALAEEFIQRSHETLFIVSDGIVLDGKDTIAAVKECGYAFHAVDSVSAEKQFLRDFRPDAIVVHKLSNSSEYIDTLKEECGFVATIDDAGEGAQRADLRINVIFHGPGATTDPQYIALRGEFQDIHQQQKIIRCEVRELLITQGGSDTYGFTPMIVQALEKMTCRPHCTVILGPSFQHDSQLDEAVQASTFDLEVARNVHNMAELMWNADLAITAGGVTMFELACVGTPALVVCGERFEAETACRMETAGSVKYLGFGGDIDYTGLADVVDVLAADVDQRTKMSTQGKELIDGRGRQRLVSLIEERVARPNGSRR